MPVSAKTYERLVLEDKESHWELVCGQLRSKPPVTTEHAWGIDELSAQCNAQMDRSVYRLRLSDGRLRVSTGSYYEPDLAIIPVAYTRQLLAIPHTFEVYDQPMPLVVEVWSRSTGKRDRDVKLAEYNLRGDAEIWLLHPYNRTVTMWRRTNPTASISERQYTETAITGGTVQLFAVPSVIIDVDRLVP